MTGLGMTAGCDPSAVTGRFLADGDAWRFEGALTLDNAAEVLAASEALPLPVSGRIDLAGLTAGDSAALAVLMALRRRAAGEARALTVVRLPAALQSLAAVYGVDRLVEGDA